jgi:hypothetical protein
MRAWEIRQKKAQKRARELARKEHQKTKKESDTFRLVIAGRESEATVVETVIVKNEDESVSEATFDEVETGTTLIVESATGLIQRVVVHEKIDVTEPEPVKEIRVKAL